MLQETAHTVGPYAWPLLPEADRARLRRRLRAAVGVVSPMVPGNAAVLLRLLDSGQLTVTGGIRAVAPVPGGFRIRHDDGELTVPAVVNAVNAPPGAVPAGARELVRSLVGGALAAPHPAGGLTPVDPRVAVVGDLSGGGPFLTSGVPGIAARAAHAARAL
ncbi:hypothetical protein JNUCC64_01355 [Streptomyces sp. JNUCC 64]